MMAATPRYPLRRGFTLVEAIATMIIIAILGSVASSLVYSGVAANRDTACRAQLHQELSTAMEAITVALREIPAAEAAPGAPGILSATSESIAWEGNSSLARSGSTLQLVQSGGPAATILTDLSELSFQCFDQSGAALPASLSGAAAQSVRRIQVQVSATRDGVTDTLRSRVFLRCMVNGAAP